MKDVLDLEKHPELKKTTLVELEAIDIINLMSLIESDLASGLCEHPDAPPDMRKQLVTAQNKLRAALTISMVTP